MKKSVTVFFCIFLFSWGNLLYAQKPATQWTPEQAWEWYDQQPWYVGFNYIPANAINYTAMWDKTSFSPDVIDKELELASRTGFNCARVVLQYVVWEDDPAYFKNTFEQFLAICDKHGIKVMPTFFDDCVFGMNRDPRIGVQFEPFEGWYAWAWSPSPGHSMVVDSTTHPKLERYVKDVMTAFREDDRIFVWDLYNEPTNGGLGDVSLPLVRKVFRWAREVNPSQPITIAYWYDNKALEDIIFANSDIITFHSYDPKEKVEALIKKLKKHKRPIICTEWLNRPRGSVVKSMLPLWFEEKIGALHWGLVNGKTQTHLPWGHRPGDPKPEVWQHDLYHNNLKPYRIEELNLFEQLIEQSKTEEYEIKHTN